MVLTEGLRPTHPARVIELTGVVMSDSGARKRASQALLAGAILAMGLLCAVSRDQPWQEAAIGAAALAMIFLAWALERRFPFRADWNRDRGDGLGDLASAGLMFGLLDPLLKWGTPLAVLAVLPAPTGGSLLPLWAEIVAVTLLIELGAWTVHWLHHRHPALWSLHAMHHSPERLYSLNNFRFHPLNHVLNHLAMILPVLALGSSAEAVLGYVALSMPVLILQHSNADLEFGWLDRWLNTSVVHRWHHADTAAEASCNYGRALVIWDRAFGTYRGTADGATPDRIGLFAASRHYPAADRFLAQLAWPFRGLTRCCRA